MAIKSSSSDNDNTEKPKKVSAKAPVKAAKSTAKSATTEEKVEAVARKARKTAVKVASAVSSTVKDIAEKIGGRKPAAKKPAAKATTTKTTTVKATKSTAKPATKKSATRVGAMANDVDSSEINSGILDSASSENLVSNDTATDVKEHFFTDKHNQQGPPPPQAPRDLPDEYGDTKLILMVRDPEWAYAYWEINDDVRQQMDLPRNDHNKNVFLRLFKITDRQWPDEPAHYFFDVEVDRHSSNWYLRLPEPNEQWCAELGIMDDHHNFLPIVRSNPIITPRNTISDSVDSEWMTVEESFEKITRLSDATIEARLRGFESNGSEAIIRQTHKQLTGILHGERSNYSSGIFSSESALPVKNKRFWLEVKTELILYGATEPDATVTVQGRTIPLNPDGTFSIRYALPDGEQVLNVHATNADGDLEESITPIVTRTTT